MLKEGYLASSSVYLSYSHKEKDIRKYLISLNKVFKKISKIIKNKKSLNKIKTRKFNY